MRNPKYFTSTQKSSSPSNRTKRVEIHSNSDSPLQTNFTPAATTGSNPNVKSTATALEPQRRTQFRNIQLP